MKKKQFLILGLVVYLASVGVFCNVIEKGVGVNFDISESDLGILCVASAYPTITRGAERIDPPPSLQASDPITQTPDVSTGIVDTQDAEVPTPATANIQYDKPLVIIYHTHATESYQPASDGNFHTQAEESTVREVGNVMTEELQKLGIEVIHDKTINDYPSYNQSYSKSLQLAQGLMAQYPTAVFVVDLHRDAAAYTGGAGKTVLVEGETAAKYSLVVGQGNPNVNALTVYANTINTKAEAMYPGFGGKIIEKQYKFNQYISDYHILLEIGNNENNIRESKATAKYFAQVLASVINDINQ